jgi:hypothetical protein
LIISCVPPIERPVLAQDTKDNITREKNGQHTYLNLIQICETWPRVFEMVSLSLLFLFCSGHTGHNMDWKYVRSNCSDRGGDRTEREDEEYCSRSFIRYCYLGHRINNIIKIFVFDAWTYGHILACGWLFSVLKRKIHLIAYIALDFTASLTLQAPDSQTLFKGKTDLCCSFLWEWLYILPHRYNNRYWEMNDLSCKFGSNAGM